MTDHPDARLMVDLASRELGGSVVWCSDDFFADVINLIKPSEPSHDPASFTSRGKAYDGWESRRRRTGDRDTAIIRLGLPGLIHEIVIDTAFFTGNAPAEVSIEAASFSDPPGVKALLAHDWQTILNRTAISPDTRTCFKLAVDRVYTHVRLTIYPDGGVSRLRILGQATPDPRFLLETVDLASLELGSSIVAASNEFYSSASNVLRPGPSRGMHEGWENARRRAPGNEHLEIALGLAGTPEVLEVDTSHFIGNAPLEVRALGLVVPPSGAVASRWVELLPRTEVWPDTPHRWLVFADDEVSRLRIDVFPDGGISRVRLWGRLSAASRQEARSRWFEQSPSSNSIGH